MNNMLGGNTPETAAHSPEIVSRLNAQFPPGSPAFALERALLQQGFKFEACESPNVKLAIFRQVRHNGLNAYQDAFGTVTWKTDASGSIVWATGNIAFTGL
ncbi:hypothetical protein [Sphingomonas sp. SUN039]|uniref:hypothetical protein n=1 Tax=Sphingomonas sp. SUN039 TaxID=2937787 RepID=UPI0021649DA0|nr:hypothetical protein [Sphingomonas sp. SUN039]UVO53330.1 hypothetical protein M0209_04035 [Sphingomonas sp. SUN039]